jgi:hypothetical protein
MTKKKNPTPGFEPGALAQIKCHTAVPSQLRCYIITGYGGHSARSRSWFFGIFYLRNLSTLGQKPIHVPL